LAAATLLSHTGEVLIDKFEGKIAEFVHLETVELRFAHLVSNDTGKYRIKITLMQMDSRTVIPTSAIVSKPILSLSTRRHVGGIFGLTNSTLMKDADFVAANLDSYPMCLNSALT
jgi:hypothetical protein